MNMKKRIYITLTPQEIEKLIRISRKNKRSKSNMIGVLIDRYQE